MRHRPRVGVSRCLLGDAVRYDGGHKRDDDLIEALEAHVEWVAVCPEVEIGMGTPREPIQLVAHIDGVASGDERVRLVGVDSGDDWTTRMCEWARAGVQALVDLRLSGFVLKARSPSCGLGGVPVLQSQPEGATLAGRGLFAQALVELLPDLPMQEEEPLRSPSVREQFLMRVLAYHQSSRPRERTR